MKHPKPPEDLKVKIGTNEEVFWTDLKKKLEADIENFRRSIEINQHIIWLAKERIRKEQKHLNT